MVNPVHCFGRAILVLLIICFAGCAVPQRVDPESGMDAWHECWRTAEMLHLSTSSALVMRLEDLRNQMGAMGETEWWRQRNDVYIALTSLLEARRQLDLKLIGSEPEFDRKSVLDRFQTEVERVGTPEEAARAAAKMNQSIETERRLANAEHQLLQFGLNPRSPFVEQIDDLRQVQDALASEEVEQRLNRLDAMVAEVLAVQEALNQRLSHIELPTEREQIRQETHAQIEQAQDLDELQRIRQAQDEMAQNPPAEARVTNGRDQSGGAEAEALLDESARQLSEEELTDALERNEELKAPDSVELGSPFEQPFYSKYSVDISPYGVDDLQGDAKTEARHITAEIQASLQLKANGDIVPIAGTKLHRKYNLHLSSEPRVSWTKSQADVSLPLLGVPIEATVTMHAWYALPVPPEAGSVVTGQTINQTEGWFRLPPGKYYILGQGKTDWGHQFDVMGSLTIDPPVNDP